MLVVMKPSADAQQIQKVVETIERIGARVHVSSGEELTVIGVIGNREHEHAAGVALEGAAGVERLMPILKPYKLAAVEMRPQSGRSVITVGQEKLGGNATKLIAGPCTVQTFEETLAIAQHVQAAGATLFRGGAYKPRTSPYDFRGLGQEGLDILAAVKAQTGLPIVTELVDVRDLEAVLGVADVIQVGARNMQNSPLLSELGKTDRTILLKRGLSATIDEFLLAAEYILAAGNERVILCERGIRTFETAYRFTLDIAAVPVLRERSHLPVIVDPSHAAGRRTLVEPLSLAALAAGADGLIVEVHPQPERAVCDGPQALLLHDFAGYVERLAEVAGALGRPMLS